MEAENIGDVRLVLLPAAMEGFREKMNGNEAQEWTSQREDEGRGWQAEQAGWWGMGTWVHLKK